MTWSPQQDAALEAIDDWINDSSAGQVFRLFGYAGTGKTTLAKEIAATIWNSGGTVLFAAFTGKAAQILREKGCSGATTIHSLIYKPYVGADGQVHFTLNVESELRDADLVIIDEVSMVNDVLAIDLLSFGVPILVLGDPAQLPPVKGEGYFINGEPDFMLTEVHRQALDSPIIRMSMDIREGKRLKPGTYGDSLVIRDKDLDIELFQEITSGADQLLCGKDATRGNFNRKIRKRRGMRGLQADWHPVLGDRLVCLRNKHDRGLLNGSLWDVCGDVKPTPNDKFLQIPVVSCWDQAMVDVTVPIELFLGRELDMDWRSRKGIEEFCFGYALTVHKSQGSQWNDVVIFDESSAFREHAKNHLYTAVTRAAERVTVIV